MPAIRKVKELSVSLAIRREFESWMISSRAFSHSRRRLFDNLRRNHSFIFHKLVRMTETRTCRARGCPVTYKQWRIVGQWARGRDDDLIGTSGVSSDIRSHKTCSVPWWIARACLPCGSPLTGVIAIPLNRHPMRLCKRHDFIKPTCERSTPYFSLHVRISRYFFTSSLKASARISLNHNSRHFFSFIIL